MMSKKKKNEGAGLRKNKVLTALPCAAGVPTLACPARTPCCKSHERSNTARDGGRGVFFITTRCRVSGCVRALFGMQGSDPEIWPC